MIGNTVYTDEGGQAHHIDDHLITGRSLAMLKAVAAGRAEVTCSCLPDLFIDGLGCCDQYTAHRLADAGLLRAATSGRTGQRVPAELTVRGEAAIAQVSPRRASA